MPSPNYTLCLPPGTHVTVEPNGNCILSHPLIELLVAARNGYDWPAGTGANISQQCVLNLEMEVAGHLDLLDADAAHQIVVRVSDWAENNDMAHAQLVGATADAKTRMQTAILELIHPGQEALGIDQLCQLPGIRLVIASKIFRFCVPLVGAAIDRHASYFFNSLPITGDGRGTYFLREWTNRRHTSSRLAIYQQNYYEINKEQYFNRYLPMLRCIANTLNMLKIKYCCAATNQMKKWRPADVEMAAYYWWACYGAR